MEWKCNPKYRKKKSEGNNRQDRNIASIYIYVCTTLYLYMSTPTVI